MAEKLYGLSAADVRKLRELIAASDTILRAAGRPGIGSASRAGSPHSFCMAKALDAVPKGEIGKFSLVTGDHQDGDSGSKDAIEAKASTRSVTAGEIVQLALTASSKWYVLGGGGGGGIRLAQTSGEWKNEPPLNVKAVQLFRQQTEEELGRAPQPWEWVPETDEFGDPVFAVTINWFSHVPVGQGDLIKWCAVTPISSLAGEYDTGQVIPDPDGGPPTPIMKPYDQLWLLIAVEC